MPVQYGKVRYGASLSAPLAERVANDAKELGMQPGRFIGALLGEVYAFSDKPVDSIEAQRCRLETGSACEAAGVKVDPLKKQK